ncbi:sterol desaturase [Hesseltinella vesiculosa]|uniref:Sterol desaturase n=1 Tax=Hesseltinella vesiculosa TaxID=101127 RepID=A0A1X2GS55_9FUNG|nr:sterol desaturase [Hesseltinella vesiculosa]
MTAAAFFVDNLIKDIHHAYEHPWSDKVLAMWMPVAAYWIYSLLFHFLMKAELPYFEYYRIHEPEQVDKRNRVSVQRVITMVVFQQLTQIVLSIIVLTPETPEALAMKNEKALARYFSLTLLAFNTLSLPTTEHQAMVFAKAIYWCIIPALQFFAGMLIMDTHQYFLHRLFHMNKFLYKHFHSHHHRLYVPYAFGALYNHPLEGLLLDSLGAVVSSELTKMSPRMCVVFFTFSTLKTVDDHCGYALPWNPFQFLFANNVQYHDVHHQAYGIKTNFSQPYFTHWDKLLGTEMAEPRKTRVNKSQ